MNHTTLTTLTAALALTLAALPAMAQVTRAKRDQCVEAGRVNGWSVERGDTLIVIVGANHRYRVTLNQHWPGLGSAARIGFVGGSDGYICGSADDSVLIEGRRLHVAQVERLDDKPSAAVR